MRARALRLGLDRETARDPDSATVTGAGTVPFLLTFLAPAADSGACGTESGMGLTSLWGSTGAGGEAAASVEPDRGPCCAW